MLKDIEIFRTLTDEQINKLEGISIIRRYNKDEFLFMEGEVPKWFYVLLKGRIKIYKTSPKGKEVFVHEFLPVSPVAKFANFGDTPFNGSAVFVEDSEVLMIDFDKFKKNFMSDANLCMEIIKSLSENFRLVQGMLHREIALGVEGKIALFISEYQDGLPSKKYAQIAQMLNTTPETFSRVITKFKKNGYISIDANKNIKILNHDKLKELYET
ncbi:MULTISPECIES: Crp/Fnr family transcriptional regulator [unclassified Campylobacter]|uniref:Crp/Fnr family transcriptional regulator n=1 Tax=unclassified Campylobacter TaxID=2593542 RepID=UPI001475EB2A|nr:MULTISPECIES: Crp/Fnr family transcriptional regulator [unclassified Campylobacter]